MNGIGRAWRDLADEAVVAWFCTVVAGVIAASYCVYRAGFPSSFEGPGRTFAIAAFLLTTGPASRLLLAAFKGSERVESHRGLTSLVSLAVLAGLGFASESWAATYGFGLVATLAGLSLLVISTAALRSARRAVLWLVPLGLLFGLWLATKSWHDGYRSPLFVEQIALGIADGKVRYGNQDTLYFVSLANMLKLHGVSSIGIDGIPFNPYHFASHWYFVRLAKLINVDLLTFYQLGFPVIVLPFVCKALADFAFDVKAAFFKGSTGLRASLSPLFWAGFLALFCLRGLFTRSDRLFSESYEFACGLMVLVLATMAPLAARLFADRGGQRQPLGASDVILAVLLVPLLLGAVSLSKISVGYALFGVLAYGWLRLGLMKRFWPTLALALCAVAFVLALGASDAGTRRPEWAPASALARQSLSAYVTKFFWPGVYLLLRVWRSRRMVSASAVARGSFIDVELVLFTAIIGVVPPMLLDLGPVFGAFSDVQRLVAGGLVLAILAVWSTASKVYPAIVLAAVVGPVLVAAPFTFVSRMNLERARIGAAGDSVTDLSSQRNFAIVRKLQDYGALPESVKRETLLFIPKSTRSYWDALPRCNAPLLAPAVAGLALLDGLPEEACEKFVAYRIYPTSFAQDSKTADPGALCARANALGFGAVIVLSEEGPSKLVDRHLACPYLPAIDGSEAERG